MKHQRKNDVFKVKMPNGHTRNIRPVISGFDSFYLNMSGMYEHGIVHLADEISGEIISFCGIDWFEKNAKEINPVTRLEVTK